MYEDDSPKMGSSKPCKPDYEEMAAKLKKKIDVFKNLKQSLIAFVEVVGNYSLKREPSSIPELLGKLELDTIRDEREYKNLLTQIEKTG